MKWPEAREVMAFAVVGLFGWAFFKNPTDTLMVGALIAAFSTAYGFYLGGSKVGSDTATRNADTVAKAAETNADPQPVKVVNEPTEPVPVEGPQ